MPYVSNKLRCYKQITKLNNYNNCLIEGDIVEIQSLGIRFDNIYDIIPTTLEFYDGKYRISYSDLSIVKIVDDESLNRTYDSDNVYLLYYEDEYVKGYRNLVRKRKSFKSLVDTDDIYYYEYEYTKGYRNLVGKTESFKSLVGRYILDWKNNNKLITDLKIHKSKYIELNYYIYF